jgi:MFS transporter, OFA family, oxalate/formate antiporter
MRSATESGENGMSDRNRWGIAVAGFLMQMALGAVYAWSVFRVPLAKQFHWSIEEVTLTFTISISVLSVLSFFGGLWMNKKGPRVVALTGGFLYGLGVFMASFSDGKLWWLYLSYGVIGGIGAGFSYIVPIAVLVKWFPDRRGLITGIAVGGFGAGALVTAPVATRLIQSVGVLQTFAYLGIAYLVITIATGYFMQNPPDGWKPASWIPSATQTAQRAAMEYTLGGALKTWQWWALWALLFLNTSAGISIISQESPMFQEIAKVDAVAAAGMIGIASIGNAFGRIFWAWVSDALTRRWTFVTMFLLQVGLFWILPGISSEATVALLSFIILMCYGGGFGTMPAFAADYFGSKNVGPIYGLMLTAWGSASAFGPLLIAHMRQSGGSYAGGLHIIACIMAASAVLPMLVSPPKSVATSVKGTRTFVAASPARLNDSKSGSTAASK